MVYDSFRKKVILFGGWDDSYFNDTWEYDGQSQQWTQVATQSKAPSMRGGHAMVYDAFRKKVILFGGRARNGNRLNDTSEYDGQT